LRYLDPLTTYNEFLNNPVQGSGADGLKLAMRDVHARLQHAKYGGRAALCHMVHDELIVECDDDPDMIAAVKEDLEAGMHVGMAPFLKKVPILVEANSGPSWADAK
jgi:DNA polymerase-1